MKFSVAFISFATVLSSVSALKLPRLEEAALFARYNPPTNYRRQAPNAGNMTAPYNAMINAYTSGTGQQAIQDDINNLTAASLAIEKSFSDTAAKLSQIDALKLAPPFLANWTALQQRWTNILWDSRTTAAQLAAYCQDFESTILPISLGKFPGQPPLTQAQVISILQGFQTDAGSFETQAQQTSDEFNKLSSDLALFSASFKSFAQAQKQLDQVMIDQINRNIKDLNSKIDTLTKQIGIIAGAIGITIFADIVLLAFFPEFAPLIIGVGAVAVAAEATAWGILDAQRREAEKELAGNRTQLISLENQLAVIASANATLSTISNTTIPAMQNNLGSFREIWNAVATDVNQVIEYIKLAQGSANSTVFIPFVVYAHLSNANSIYAPLGNALVKYSDGIGHSGLPAPTISSISAVKLAASVPAGAKFTTASPHPFTDISQVYFGPTVEKVKQMVADYRKSI